MSPIDALRAARALIANPQNWITGEYARSPDGRCVAPVHIEACMFCAVGALARVAGLRPKQVEQEKDCLAGFFLNQAAGLGSHPHEINDHEGHAAVLAMYDRAIALAEASAPSPAERAT